MKSNDDFPGISIVIACLNEEKHIGKCLDSLLAQNYSGSMEIIIADGGSSDGTPKILSQYEKDNSFIKIIENKKKIQSAGRNSAIRSAKYDLVAYIDAHSFAAYDWLTQLYRAYERLTGDDDAVIGVGSIHLDADESTFTKATKSVFNSFAGGNMLTSYSDKKGISETNTAYACLYNKSKLIAAGLYDESFVKGEDLELNWRLTKKLGFKLFVNSSAITYYHMKPDISGLIRQINSYGFWRLKVMQKLKTISIGSVLPVLFYLFIALSLAVSFLFPILLLLAIPLYFLYLFVILIESVSISFRIGESFVLIFTIILSIHLSYVTGFMEALIFGKRSE